MGDGVSDRNYCCQDLQEQVEFHCTEHPQYASCGDYLIGYNPVFDEYGVWIHDGLAGEATSWISIAFCPFCGTRLPPSRRDEWFDRLEIAGVEPEDAPAELRRYGWWLNP